MTTLTTEQVAEQLHMQPANVRALARRGDLEASYVGRRWLVTDQAVTDYLATTSNRAKRSDRRKRRRSA